MQQLTARRLRMGYAVFLGLYTVVIGILYIVSAADIYYSGAGGTADIYSRELVADRLYLLLVPSVLWIAAVIAGFVLSVLFPMREIIPKTDRHTVLKKLRRRMPAGEGEEFLAERDRFRRAEGVRFAVWCLCAAVWLLAAVMSAVYLFNTAHFPAADINGEVLSMLCGILPYIGAAFAVCCGALVFETFYCREQLKRMKNLLLLGRGAPTEAPSPAQKTLGCVRAALASENAVVAARLVLLALGVLLFVLGLFNGGIEDVLRKAVMICTECIGLG